MDSISEQDLVEKCRRGNRRAQRELFELTSDRIFHLLLRMTGSKDDAFDLSQETYLKGFTQIEKFDGRSSIATWFYRIAVNEALQFLRRAETMRINLANSAQEPDNGKCPVEETSVRLDVQAALTGVEPTDRAILLLRYQDGLDYRAISDVVGCAEGTVASRLSRARNRLREILRKSYNVREENDATVHPKGGR